MSTVNSANSKKSSKLSKNWVLYLREFSDQSLDPGIINRPLIRRENHQAGTGAHYTRSRLPVKLINTEYCSGRSETSKRVPPKKILKK